MLKKRKWPLKGWHKRFFVLDNGILKYSKSPIDVSNPDYNPQAETGQPSLISAWLEHDSAETSATRVVMLNVCRHDRNRDQRIVHSVDHLFSRFGCS
ncbi:Oxysterol-binding protein-related protein 6 [Liparis tanakae]|uniref:Oxysterol-binding protein-related protein 6 n=1 Tax=Liparis tanakae TaxID=230148 RepID=A0A4Z2EAC9_9TELE|nr:Oxysterol-binding protein-related protein 6 [Liparis tanakae]